MSVVAISQSNYIPWLGYFDLIASVNDFVFLDNVQYTKRDWRNRNQIKTPHGKLWLSASIKRFDGSPVINEIILKDDGWKEKHLELIRRNYRRAKFFEIIFPEIESLYLNSKAITLSEFNQELIKNLSKGLSITTKFHDSTSFNSRPDSTLRLLDICLALKASRYVSGPAAKDYLDVEKFQENGVSVDWFSYSSKPYNQLWGEFDPGVTVLDPIFNNGWDILKLIRSKR